MQTIRVVLGCSPVQSSMPVTETLAVWNNPENWEDAWWQDGTPSPSQKLKRKSHARRSRWPK
jgi:hypothetical protein